MKSTCWHWSACATLTIGLLLHTQSSKADDKPKDEKWTALFDGKSLDGWKITEFGGQGDVEAVDGRMVIEMGSPMSGVTFAKKDFPKVDYEIRLEAMRVKGDDFFCGLTFPVRDSYCSFIVGGWAGSVVGISSIDGRDASENDTTQVKKFED